jgi:hypothetical protein
MIVFFDADDTPFSVSLLLLLLLLLLLFSLQLAFNHAFTMVRWTKEMSIMVIQGGFSSGGFTFAVTKHGEFLRYTDATKAWGYIAFINNR